MGLTYANKPAFVDRIIEAGSHSFLLAFSNLLEFSANVETGEQIAHIDDSKGSLSRAFWSAEKSVALYEDLLNDLNTMTVSPAITNVVSGIDFVDLQKQIVQTGDFIFVQEIWDEIVGFVQNSSPLEALGVFFEYLKKAMDLIGKLQDSVDDGHLDMWLLHQTISACSKALLVGQYIAAINRYSRENFATS